MSHAEDDNADKWQAVRILSLATTRQLRDLAAHYGIDRREVSRVGKQILVHELAERHGADIVASTLRHYRDRGHE